MPRLDVGALFDGWYDVPMNSERQRLPRWLHCVLAAARFALWFLFALVIAVSIVVLPFAAWLEELTGGD
jgi:hypothetical protein